MFSTPISNGVVCYNGTAEMSLAGYICDVNFDLVGETTRVCQSDGFWNGSIPTCGELHSCPNLFIHTQFFSRYWLLWGQLNPLPSIHMYRNQLIVWLLEKLISNIMLVKCCQNAKNFMYEQDSPVAWLDWCQPWNHAVSPLTTNVCITRHQTCSFKCYSIHMSQTICDVNFSNVLVRSVLYYIQPPYIYNLLSLCNYGKRSV